MQRTSKATHEYPCGCQRKVGDRFDVDPGDVPILLALGWIEPEQGDPGYQGLTMESSQPAGYKTRDIKRQARKAA